jgi:hypothetical protein
LIASKDELLISKSRIFLSIRALRTTSLFACPVSDFTGLCAADERWVSTEVIDPLLRIRGLSPGIDSDAAHSASTGDSTVDTIIGLGFRPSLGWIPLLAESRLDDLMCLTAGIGGLAGKAPENEL